MSNVLFKRVVLGEILSAFRKVDFFLRRYAIMPIKEADSMKKESGELKKRANLAKQRLKMGYWQSLLKERDDLITLGGDTPQAKRRAEEVKRNRFNRDNMISLDSERIKEDELLYQKVKAILEKDEDTCNPIGQLIDYEAYGRMDPMAKQKYVLYLSAKYREMRDRYYLERIKSC